MKPISVWEVVPALLLLSCNTSQMTPTAMPMTIPTTNTSGRATVKTRAIQRRLLVIRRLPTGGLLLV